VNFVPDSIIAAFENEGVFSVGTISVQGFNIPANLARCLYRSTTTPEIGDFTVAAELAADIDNVDLSPLPTIEITAIDLVAAAAN
jgi:hypothetical protein